MRCIRRLRALAPGICFSTLLVVLLSCQQGAPTSQIRSSSRLPSFDADRAAWRKVLGWSNECEQEFQAGPGGQPGLQFYKLGGETRLAEVACASGAYQGSQQYYLFSESDRSQPVKQLQLPTYEATGADGKHLVGKEETEITGLPEFNNSAKTLTILDRYRGIGDCGSYATYVFDGDRVLLKEFRAKLDCDGQGAEHPEQWSLMQ